MVGGKSSNVLHSSAAAFSLQGGSEDLSGGGENFSSHSHVNAERTSLSLGLWLTVSVCE